MPAAHAHTMICSGHGCYPPRPNAQASPDVYVGNLGWHRVTDAWMVHCCSLSCHSSVLAAGSPTVFANNLAVARIGDPVACGSTAIQGNTTVFADG